MSLLSRISGKDAISEFEREMTEHRARVAEVEAEGKYSAHYDLADPQQWCCLRCGCMVGNRDLHDRAMHP
jgi:hypothetical protein